MQAPHSAARNPNPRPLPGGRSRDTPDRTVPSAFDQGAPLKARTRVRLVKVPLRLATGSAALAWHIAARAVAGCPRSILTVPPRRASRASGPVALDRAARGIPVALRCPARPLVGQAHRPLVGRAHRAPGRQPRRAPGSQRRPSAGCRIRQPAARRASPRHPRAFRPYPVRGRASRFRRRAEHRP